MVKYFKLTSSDDQYNEFLFGLDSFLINFKYNPVNKRYYLDIYKNGKLMLKSHKLMWSRYNILSSYKHKNIGEIYCISEAFDILEDNKTQVLQELTKDNITKFMFKWSYNE